MMNSELLKGLLQLQAPIELTILSTHKVRSLHCQSLSDQATLVDGATTHNLWQENKFAVRVEKFITWAKRRPIASAVLDYTPAQGG